MPDMANKFIYFFPGKPSVCRDDMRGYGLANSIGRHAAYSASECDGPNGHGYLLRQGQPPETPLPRYEPDGQAWLECEGGKFWVGYDKAARPGPDDLILADETGGYLIEMGDGNRWLVPTARFDADGEDASCLTCAIIMEANGKLVHRPLPRYDRLIEYATTAWDMFEHHDGNRAEPPVADEMFKFNACVEALAGNYAVTKWEVGLLGLVTTQSQTLALMAICDRVSHLRRLESLQKKRSDSTADGSPSSGGETA